MAHRVITLLGEPIVTEPGKATEAIKPGMLVKGEASVSLQTIDGLKAPMRIALERDEAGRGIDTTYGSESSDYAVDDIVKVGHFGHGMRFLGWVASGANLAADALVESSGNGKFEALAGAEPLARVVEAVDNSAGPGDARIVLEVI